MPRRNPHQGYNRATISLSMDRDALESLRAYCATAHLSISALMEAAVLHAADRLMKGEVELDVVRWNVVRIVEPGTLKTSELLRQRFDAATATTEA